MPHSVLIIDDEATLAENIQTYLSRRGYDARAVGSGQHGLATLEEFKPDLVLLDYDLPDIDGLDVLRKIRAIDRQVKVIMLTGKGGVQLAVDAMKIGAHDYLSKPVSLNELKLLLDKAVGQTRLEGALAYFHDRQARHSGLSNMLGESPAIVALKGQVGRFINAEQQLTDGEPPTVLLTGETGTGKSVIARAFHFDGPRCDKPFVEINCAAIPEHLVEAELFGFERGAFTDAKQRKVGLVESANGGTLFLDEIGDMDLGLQAKVLRLLEDKVVRRVGGLREHKVDLRIIAASNRDLDQRMNEGAFRSDLLFRLRILHIKMPPLRECGDDAWLLANAFLKLHGVRYGKPEMHFNRASEAVLRQHQWPGNVRELRNVIEHAVLVCESDVIEVTDLGLSPGLKNEVESQLDGVGFLPSIPDEALNLANIERKFVTEALERTGWNVTRAAGLLGISRDTLRYRMEKYGLAAEMTRVE